MDLYFTGFPVVLSPVLEGYRELGVLGRGAKGPLCVEGAVAPRSEFELCAPAPCCGEAVHVVDHSEQVLGRAEPEAEQVIDEASEERRAEPVPLKGGEACEQEGCHEDVSDADTGGGAH